jgi:hypothetical protein
MHGTLEWQAAMEALILVTEQGPEYVRPYWDHASLEPW